MVSDHLIYADRAQSGARADRQGLLDLVAAAQRRLFQVLFVDDLSRIARDATRLLVTLNDLEFSRVRVVSVADGLDTADDRAVLGFQVRAVFNELLLSDLRDKTLRGQRGQKARGYFVGEATFGYRSQPSGPVSRDKHGRPRPAGYVMRPDPEEARIVLRIFQEAAEAVSFTAIARGLNRDRVPGRFRAAGGWTVGSVRRILANAKYVGHWVWNKRGTKRDRLTGRRQQVDKPESEWVVHDDPALRIVPQQLWDRLREVARVYKRVPARRGFAAGHGSREHAYPRHLLAGAMACAVCNRAIVLVSGKAGGYYGCSGAARRGCGNRVRVRRHVAETVILGALSERVLQPDPVSRVLDQVRHQITVLSETVPDLLKTKRAQLEEARRRVSRIVNFVTSGGAGDSPALAAALARDEESVRSLEVEVRVLGETSGPRVPFPSRAWIVKRLAVLRDLLQRRTEASGLLLRRLLGRIVLEPVYPEEGAPYYLARTALDVLVLLESFGSDSGSSSISGSGPAPGPRSSLDPRAAVLAWWRRRESNPRPRVRRSRILHA